VKEDKVHSLRERSTVKNAQKLSRLPLSLLQRNMRYFSLYVKQEKEFPKPFR
jgi:hypothetical protein